MKIAIINGSRRKGRFSVHVSEYILKSLKKDVGIDVKMLDIKEYDFPVMEERMRFLDKIPPGMEDFSQTMKEADGLIFVTPEYNGSYSGALKNTLDYFKSEYDNKPMGLVTVSDGKMGGANAMHHLQAWAIHVKGIVSPHKLYVSNVGQKFNQNGELLDESFSSSVDRFLEKYLWLCRAISSYKNDN
jgi:azobenzene reductase